MTRPPGDGPDAAPHHPRSRSVAARRGCVVQQLLVAAVIIASIAYGRAPLMGQDPPPVTISTSPASTAERARAFAPVDARIAEWIASGYYGGASLQVEQNGVVLWSRLYGDHRPDSVAYIASAGKWLAAATIMSVVDSGTLSLDDQVSTVLPVFTGSRGTATLRQLLSHTSGYPAYQPIGSHPDSYQTLTEAVAMIVPLAQDHAPGAEFVYGGLAMQIAGRMAEIASGLDFETLFQRAIARPVGMTATHFTPVDDGLGHSPMLAGGARSTLSDYSRFLAMIAADGMCDGRRRVLSARAIAALQSDQVRGAHLPPDNFVTAVRRSPHPGVYGLGEWRELEDPAGRAILISSPSWAGTYPWLDARHHLSCVFLAHVHGPVLGHFDQFNPMTASAELPVLVDQALRTLDAGTSPAPQHP